MSEVTGELPDERGFISIAVDVGGTFTDVVLQRGEARFSTKVLTTPHAPEDAVLAGAQALLEQAGHLWPQVGRLVLGTTLATNALIERKGAKTALLTTAGFRDLVEIGLEDRYAQYDVFLEKPQPLVPRYWRYGIHERVDAHGQVVHALDEAQVIELTKTLREQGIESVAVGFLHSYAHSAHERRVRDLFRQHAPEIWVSLSSEVSAEIREYPRLSTVCANAYVQPIVSSYLRRLQQRLRERGLGVAPYLMTSSGAISTIEQGIAQPVRLVESGPAGGAILAREVARQLQLTQALSFDMGGTTAKICYVDDYTPTITQNFEFGRVRRHQKGSGLPIRVPVVEMVEIGAGGGSIGRVDALGLVRVGPDSAGAVPGPASYRRGGTLPTVTDAHVLTGAIDPGSFAAGTIELDPALARKAFDESLASAVEGDAVVAATAVIEVVTEDMANAARVHASELGKTVEHYSLIAFGGAAALHAASMARKLGLARVVVPESAGVGSAIGFLLAPISYQAVRTFRQNVDQVDLVAVNTLLAELARDVDDVVKQAAPGAAIRHRRQVFMRYVGQGHELVIDLDERADDINAASLVELRERFEQHYAHVYGRSLSHIGVEILSWSVLARAELPEHHATDRLDAAGAPALPAGSRRWYDAQHEQWREVPVYARDALTSGQSIPGPAIVTEAGTTTVVPAGFIARKSVLGALVLDDTARAASVQQEASASLEGVEQ
ncbi:MAG TPA: hydantoinase/oxoprolinase family protein [Paraburkholderia sp.]|nr:hydantoinase/oxoprolinase family protein [Paraburkholderia sp.]